MPILPSVNHPINCGLATTLSFARQFSKQTIANRSIDVFVTPSMRGSGSINETTSEIVGDINWLKQTFASSVSDCDVLIVGVGPFFEIKSIKSLNTNILSNPTQENPRKLIYQSSGTSSIEVELTNGERSAVGFTTYSQAALPIYTFQNYINGSLLKHMYDQVSAIADGSTSSPNHYPIYSTFNQTSNEYVKNSEFWANELDFSGVSVNKVGSGGVTGVVMVTPRHAIGAAHYSPPADPNGGPIVGDKIYFCDSSNNTVERTVVGVINTVADARIIKFNADVPSSVKKYKFIPSNWRNFLPTNYQHFSIDGNGNTLWINNYAATYAPLIIMSHYRWDEGWPLQRSNRYAYIYESYIFIRTYNNGAQSTAPSVIGGPDVDEQFIDYNGEPSGIRGGDSGLPCFYLVNGDLIFAMKHYFPAAGPFLSDFLTDLQNGINSLGSEGYSLQTADISGFTDFSS